MLRGNRLLFFLMNDIGEFTLLVALATAIYGRVAYVMAARGNRIDLYLSADKTPLIVWGCVTVSYTHLTLPTIYSV